MHVYGPMVVIGGLLAGMVPHSGTRAVGADARVCSRMCGEANNWSYSVRWYESGCFRPPWLDPGRISDMGDL